MTTRILNRILNLGSINIDYVYAVPHFVQAGETLSSTGRRIFPGGKGLNQSIALARAGGDVTHAGMVGSEGAYLLDILRDAGVDAGLVSTGTGPSGHTVIQVNPQGENCILLFPGANTEIDGAFVDRALNGFGEGDILVLQNEVSCAAYAMNAAKARGMKIAFNPSPFGPEIAGYPLGLVDWLLLNEVEASALTNLADNKSPDDMLNAMGDMYPGAVIVLTLGKDGVICRADGKTYRHGIYPVKAVDTTAAGDTFTGYFISSVAAGKSIAEALEIASMASAISVSKPGAAESIPDISDINISFMRKIFV